MSDLDKIWLLAKRLNVSEAEVIEALTVHGQKNVLDQLNIEIKSLKKSKRR